MNTIATPTLVELCEDARKQAAAEGRLQDAALFRECAEELRRLPVCESQLKEAQSCIREYCKAASNKTWQIKMVGDGSFQYVLPWYTVTEKEYLSWPGRKRHMYVVADVDPVSPPDENPIRNEGDIARFVNNVRDIAKDYSQTQQLRERLAYVLVPVLKQLAEKE